MAEHIPEQPLTESAFGELVVLCNQIANESLTYFGGFQPNTPQRDRRAFIHAFFASAEALLWTLRRLALSRHYAGKVVLPAEELKRLRKELRLGPEQTMSLVLSGFATAYGISFSDPFAGQSQSPAALEFRELIKVRHRLTHPKRLDEFDIRDAELDRLRQAHQWFWTVTMGLMNDVASQHQQRWL